MSFFRKRIGQLTVLALVIYELRAILKLWPHVKDGTIWPHLGGGLVWPYVTFAGWLVVVPVAIIALACWAAGGAGRR